jgi:hypothetical protein
MAQDFEPRSGEYIPRNGEPSARAGAARLVRVPFVGTLGFGSMLAISISYFHNQSILWAILHGLLSWFFVIYAALFYD